MKQFLMKKSNIVLLAIAAVVIVVGAACLLPSGAGGASAGGADGYMSDSLSAAGETQTLGDGKTPLSDTGAAPDTGTLVKDLASIDEGGRTPGQGGGAADAASSAVVAAIAAAEDVYGQNSGAAGGSGQGGGGDNGDSNGGAGSGGTVTLSIDCATILNNMDKLDPNKASIFPSGGVIMASRSVSFSEGESVFDVLSRECRNSGILVASMTSPVYQSAYIQYISNLGEFDVGSLSGWMYNVNGWYPNYGCSKYILKDGDVIQWRYTCDLGADVGGGGVTQG